MVASLTAALGSGSTALHGMSIRFAAPSGWCFAILIGRKVHRKQRKRRRARNDLQTFNASSDGWLRQRELLEEPPGIVRHQVVVWVVGVDEIVTAPRTTIHHLSSGFAGRVSLADAARRHLVLRALVIRQPFVHIRVSPADLYCAII